VRAKLRSRSRARLRLKCCSSRDNAGRFVIIVLQHVAISQYLAPEQGNMEKKFRCFKSEAVEPTATDRAGDLSLN